MRSEQRNSSKRKKMGLFKNIDLGKLTSGLAKTRSAIFNRISEAITGKVKLDEEEGLSQSERDEGYVLTCVGHPMTDDVVIEIG